MDAATFPSKILTDGHTEPSEQNRNCIFCFIFGEKFHYHICTVASCTVVFILFLFQASWYVQYTFLKDGSESKNYLLVIQITFWSCIF